MRRLIRGATVVPLDGLRQVRRTDVLLEDGAIKATGGVDVDDALITETRLTLMPAFVQTQVELGRALLGKARAPSSDPRVFLELQAPAWEQGADRDEITLQIRAALAKALASGSATYVDLSRTHRDSAMKAAVDLGARWIGLVDATPGDLAVVEHQMSSWMPHTQDRVHFGLFIDLVAASAEAVQRACGLAHQRDLPLILKLDPFAGRDQGLAALERKNLLSDHLILCGARECLRDAALVADLGSAGVSVVLTPAHDLVLGAPKIDLEPLLSAGINLALGSADAVSSLEFCAFSEARLLGRQLQSITDAPASLALEIATRGGARALRLKSGSIGVGLRADMQLLELEIDPALGHESAAAQILGAGGSEVVRTLWIDGQVVSGELLSARQPEWDAVSRLQERLGARVRDKEVSIAGRALRARAWVGRHLRRRNGWR